MTKLTICLFGYNEAQTITTRNLDGDYWYMAATICELMGLSNHSLAVHNNLDDDEWRKESIHIGGYGKKNVLLVSTIGMLKLIVQGRTPYALKTCERIFQVSPNLRTDGWPTEIIENEQ